MINLDSDFSRAYDELTEINEAAQKKYEICYREDEDGPKKRFTVVAGSVEEAKRIAWSRVDAEDIWVFEIKEDLQEAIKVVSDPDALFHYTSPLPFCRILKANAIKRKAGHDDYAVCFTTDAKYRIHGNTCGFQLSRQKLVDAGYELQDWDDAGEDDPEFADYYAEFPRAEDARTESEERVYKDVINLRNLLTAVHIHWSPEGMTQDQAPDSNKYSFIEVAQSERGDVIDDEDPRSGEALVWKIDMAYFRRQLRELAAAGIKVHEYGTPMKDIYWLDSQGKLHDGPMPTAEPETPEVASEPVLV